MKKNPEISLIIACYNEGRGFENNVETVLNVLEKLKKSYEVIFVDDKSRDNTIQNIKKIKNKYKNINIKTIFHPQNTGRGKTVTDGILASSGKIVGFLDIDLEVPAHYIGIFVNSIENGVDISIGSRIYEFQPKSLVRWFASKGYVYLIKKLLKLPFRDTEAGYKFFNREKILPVLKECRDPGWFWDTEIIARSNKRGLKIIEIPVVFIRDYNKNSTVRVFSDSIDYMKKLIKYRKELVK